MAAQGLDRATAPSAEQAKRMLAEIGGRWWNVYIGGPESGGHGWSPAVVADYVRHGIDRFMLTYVGRQRHGPLTAAQGLADGRDAVNIAKSYGYTGNFPLCLDVELPTFESAPAKTIEYAKAWCTAVKHAGARAGVYANAAPLKEMAAGQVPADFVWVASWVGHGAAPHDPHSISNLPNHLWSEPGQRAWQYAGAYAGQPCRVLGLDVDISVADLGCLAGPPGVPVTAPVAHTAGVLRAGDRGVGVRRLTRRLSFVRSKTTRKPYLGGTRSHYDDATVRAVKAFQREHKLDDDGKFGTLTRAKLAKAVEVEKARRQQVGAVTSAPADAKKVPAAAAKVDLALLIERALTADERADAALEDLLAYGLLRRRELQRLKKQQAVSAPALLMQIVSLLKDIDEDVAHIGEAMHEQQAAGALAASVATATQAPASDMPTTSLLVTQTAPIAPPAPEGPALIPPPDGHTPMPAAGGLGEIPDRDIVLLIRGHSAAIDAARAELIERFKRYDAALAKLRPASPAHRSKQPARDSAVVKPHKRVDVDKHGPSGKVTPPPQITNDSVADIRLGDQAHIVRASKLALARFLAAKGNPEHGKLRRALKRDARLRKRGETATQTWRQGVRAAQHLTGRPATGVMDGALQAALKPYWPSDSAARKLARATPGWRAIKGQVSPNFNLREFACKDGTPYVAGLVHEQGLSKSQARQRARELAKRLERVRKAGGGQPIQVNSVFRTKAHNASVGGKPNSAHLRGLAADIAPPAGVSLATHRENVRKAFECGCGYYPRQNFVHGDYDKSLGQRNWTG